MELTPGTHDDRQRAESFGALADRYDEIRPGYPAELIAWLTADGPGRAVDVGCGTGRVARALRDAGWSVTGVEIDARMAAVARHHGIPVDVGRFEDWQPAGPAGFDLICSGQAWHWVDPDIGFARAADLLRPGGRFAAFWNRDRYGPPVTEALREVFDRHAPGVWGDGAGSGEVGAVPGGADSNNPGRSRYRADLERRLDPRFTPTERPVFHHQRALTIAQWLEEASTHSPIALLPDAQRQALFDAAAACLARLTDGTVTVHYDTYVLSTRRLDR